MTFDLVVNCPVNLRVESQVWDAGLRLLSGETRARCKTGLHLTCECVTRVEKSGGLLPDAVVRLRIVKSQLFYSDLVVEHTAGVGGDAARFLGDTFQHLLHQWRPDLERKLIERADAAIVKAGDTKEIRLSLSQLLPGLK